LNRNDRVTASERGDLDREALRAVCDVLFVTRASCENPITITIVAPDRRVDEHTAIVSA
jgi:hypothetical protein